ncbi:response regulator [Alteromonas lipolytica]|uniref:Response regulatory domain-containing protein n=1 Tax=Alteromonas lipolytica TaxID=1856405 RepID=A0A1E8FGP3_9ALTE|nr:response regulator [Alteromonas lipolytica]OFI35101.1 hypothetical protein BFC17_16270 [Alteromonas lipolytica]GGF56671.1 hypothetical protein GCM10011338_06210 [Alteromonas lipolytica]
MVQKLRVAIIEDNATARTTIRSHLINMGNLEVASFSTGGELKNVLRKQHFELLIFDFHLGQRRNGVEWVQSLRQSDFLRPSTGIIFLTADRMPQTIGQIIDIHPDLLLLKPYTINSLQRGLKHYLEYRRQAGRALTYLDDGLCDKAIAYLKNQLSQPQSSRVKSDLEKLQARLLLQQHQYADALTIYQQVLQQSDKVLWAQWGKLKCQFLMGNWPDCQTSLDTMLDTLLTRDKAFEWLACLSFEQAAYEKTEYYLDHIQDSDLSLPATRLKTMTYQKQNRAIESIDLLQKKREYNRSTKERFDEFTFELAEFYLSIAQNSPASNRTESLSQARKLAGVAARSNGDSQIRQRHDYLLAYSYILEDQPDKAESLTQREHMQVFNRSSANTLITAARVYSALDNETLAVQLMDFAKQKSDTGEMPTEQQTLQSRLVSAEQESGLAASRADVFNEKGQKLFIQQAYQEALAAFYYALQLQPEVPAIALNMLQTLLVEKQTSYRNLLLRDLVLQINQSELTESNQQRFARLKRQYAQINEVLHAASHSTHPR